MKDFLKGALEKYPRLYLEILRVKRRGHWSQQWVVSRNTEVVIEGFPRSANSFARAAFTSMQPAVRVATHVHSSAQVVQACAWGLPTLMLLRDAAGAVCGDLAFACELSGRDPASAMPAEFDASLMRYIRFYEAVEPHSERYVIGHFPDVTRDFGAVMRRLNAHFGTNFVIFDHTPEAAKAIMEKSTHIGPQANREEIKSVIREKFNNDASPQLKNRADAVYRRLLDAQGLARSSGTAGRA